MKILILGSGGREHAIAWKISKSPLCNELFVAPGNGGTDAIATNLVVEINDQKAVFEILLKYQIDLLIIGPEDPLVNGLVDFLKQKTELAQLMIVGPSALGAKL